MKLNLKHFNSDRIQAYIVGIVWVILFAVLLSFGHAKDKKLRESLNPQTSICDSQKLRRVK